MTTNASSTDASSLRGSNPTSAVAPSCLPRRNIFFLKTHKCASSTVQNVLLRYGASHDLNFVLPTLGNYLGNQAPFHRAMTSMAPWHRIGYNIFCHHTVFDETEVAAVLPADAVYISIVRQPVDLFESLYSYANLQLHYKQDLEEFTARHRPDASTFFDRSEGYLGVNQMAYDFGIRPAQFSNASAVSEAIQRLERRFDLVLVAERFDESMILLKELLCWSLRDVAYFRHNARRQEMRRRLSVETENRLRELNRVDQQIYRHFEKRFRQRVAAFGERRMKEEVARLRRMNDALWRACVGDGVATSSAHGAFRTFSDQVEELTVKSESARNATCQHMVKSEIAFTSQLKMSQTMKALRLAAERPGNERLRAIEGAQMWFRRLSEEVGFVAFNMSGAG